MLNSSKNNVWELPKILLEELSYHVTTEDLRKADTLNEAQRAIFDEVLNLINQGEGGVLFVDGPTGSGKTYLYDCLLAHVRINRKIALSVASFSIAALLLHGTELARLLQETTLIIWDEAPMTHCHVPEAVDRTLRDIMENELPFGGKIFLFGGDFQQVLPVVHKGTRTQIVNAALNNKKFAEYLLRIGNGTEPTIGNNLIQLPDKMIIHPQNGKDPINLLIDTIYPNLTENSANITFLTTERAILTPLNNDVDVINERIMAKYPGEKLPEDDQNLYPIEYLNSITPQGLPPHELTLKTNVSIMLLRNLDPVNGLCNGTRLICKQLQTRTIEAEIITGDHKGRHVFIPRITLMSTENAGLPFVLKRKQFPVRPAFALTIKQIPRPNTVSYWSIPTTTCLYSWTIVRSHVKEALVL
ncbi:20320_t:CDS:2 [Entrophospora sp. SA101]|nr:20320_t:CDS:2 [Entrophospora sp. SA101]